MDQAVNMLTNGDDCNYSGGEIFAKLRTSAVWRELNMLLPFPWSNVPAITMRALHFTFLSAMQDCLQVAKKSRWEVITGSSYKCHALKNCIR